MEAPTGLSQAYIDEYSGRKLIVVSAVFIPILLSFVGLRFYSRHLSKTKLGLDDLLVVVSLCLQIASSAIAIAFVNYGGVGHHFAAWEEVDPEKTIVYFKYLLVVSFCYFFFVAWPKLAILALYLRLFTLKPYRITVYVLASIVICTGIVTPIMSLNLCHPFEFNWNRTIPGGSCLDEQAFYRWGSLPNIITDIAMLILPLPIVWRLHTSLKLKVGLTVAFTTGSLGLATSILRFTSFFQGSAILDGTWASVDLMIWTVVEPDVYLIAACLPTFRPIFVHLLQGTSLISKSSQSKGYVSKGGSRGTPLGKTGTHNSHAAGFQLFGEAKISSDTASFEDDIDLMHVADNKPRSSFIPSNGIRVQNEYNVTIGRA